MASLIYYFLMTPCNYKTFLKESKQFILVKSLIFQGPFLSSFRTSGCLLLQCSHTALSYMSQCPLLSDAPGLALHYIFQCLSMVSPLRHLLDIYQLLFLLEDSIYNKTYKIRIFSDYFLQSSLSDIHS